MLRSWLRARRERKAAVQAEADRLVVEHGGFARFHAMTPLMKAADQKEAAFRRDVMAAVERRIGYRPGADSATRMLNR